MADKAAIQVEVQQAIAQVLMRIYDPHFSEHSYGFRPNRSAHDAIEQVLEYLDDGYQWVIDLDIEKYFDTVNHDKLISIIRERVNDKTTLHLIRSFLKAGIMEDGLVKPNKIGVPQGGPLSPILSKLYNKIRELLCRRKAAAQPLSLVFTKVNQVVRGWINYFKIGGMKYFLFKFSQWLRHKIRVVIIKQWKLPRRIYTNLMRINKALKCNFSDEDIHKVANTRLGLV